MLYSIFVFSLLYLFTLYSSNQISYSIVKGNSKIFKINRFLLLASFSLIVGLRWDVGVDYLSYYYLYNGMYVYDSSIERIELIPRMLMSLGSFFDLPFYSWFITMAFIQIYFVYKAVLKINPSYLQISVFVFLVFFLAHDMNIVRQGCAYSIVLYAFTFFLDDSKYRVHKSIIYIIVAFLFHKSAIVILPVILLFFYFEQKSKYTRYSRFINNKYIQVFVYLIAAIGGPILVNFISEEFRPLFLFLVSDNKYEEIMNDDILESVSSGYGVLISDIICITLILCSDRILKDKNKERIFYWAFFIGACLYHATMQQQYFQRMNNYFFFCIIVVCAMVLYKQKNVLPKFICIGGSAALAFASFLSTEWKFVWD